MKAVFVVLLVLLAVTAVLAAGRHHSKSKHSRHHRNARSLHRLHRHVGPTDKGYQGQSVAEKANELWALISKAYPAGAMKTYAAAPNLLKGITVSGGIQGFDYTFNTTSDSMPTPFFSPMTRQKFIHPLGAVAKINWKQTAAGAAADFTGLFAESSLTGFVRLGWAADPHKKEPVAIPGVGVKLLRAGKPSSNFMVMYGLEGQGDQPNFFANDYTNHLPDPKAFAITAGGKLFTLGTGTPFPTRLGVHTMSEIDAEGKAVPQPIGVWKLVFKPVASTHSAYQAALDAKKESLASAPKPAKAGLFSGTPALAPEHDVYEPRDILATFEKGTVLWNVFAIPFPEGENEESVCDTLTKSTSGDGAATAEYNGKMAAAGEIHIADVIIEEQFVASPYGDEKLFFQHEFFCAKKNIAKGFLWNNLARLRRVIGYSGAQATPVLPSLEGAKEEDVQEQEVDPQNHLWQTLW